MENSEQAFLEVMASRKRVGQLRERREMAHRRPHAPYTDIDQMKELVHHLKSLFPDCRGKEGKMMAENEFYTLKEVAELIRMSATNVVRMIKAGEGPEYYRFGRSYRIMISDFETWKEQQKGRGIEYFEGEDDDG